MNRKTIIFTLQIIICIIIFAISASAADSLKDNIYNPGKLKPVDSRLNVKVGEPAPDFNLPSVRGGNIRLSDYKNKKNVVLSFVPAAWTPVCSDQWPGYNITQEMFQEKNAELIGITVDNIPTLFAWTKQMGRLWFPVLSDFWPHGEAAKKFGVLRSDGTSERALIFINKKGIISFIHVEDINVRPKLEVVAEGLATFEP